MTLTELKKQLKTMSQEELIDLLCKVYKGSKQAQALVDVALCGDAAEQALLSAYKKRVHDAFWGKQYSLKKARDAVLEFNKIAKNVENAAELMLYHVECGVDFTCEYGDIDEPFYGSVESMFSNFVTTVNHMDTADYYQRNAERILGIIRKADDCGWGFPYTLMELYHEIVWRTEDE